MARLLHLRSGEDGFLDRLLRAQKAAGHEVAVLSLQPGGVEMGGDPQTPDDAGNPPISGRILLDRLLEADVGVGW